MRIAALLMVLLLGPAAVAGEAQPLDQWIAYNGASLPSSWTISEGVIRHRPGGGDIRTVEEYSNFVLEFEWQISAGGNSGVFYRVPPDGGALDGPEYQILDNAGHPDGRSPLTSAGSTYGIVAPNMDLTRPVGEWNNARILVEGNHVEHWLNGSEVLQYELGSADWQTRVAASKFDRTPYGTAPRGYIVLQDHGAPVAYRNLRLTVLP